jgi:hypothetical protein
MPRLGKLKHVDGCEERCGLGGRNNRSVPLPQKASVSICVSLIDCRFCSLLADKFSVCLFGLADRVFLLFLVFSLLFRLFVFAFVLHSLSFCRALFLLA